MSLLRPDTSFSLFKSYQSLQDSPILSCVTVATNPLVTVSCGMSGQVVLCTYFRCFNGPLLSFDLSRTLFLSLALVKLGALPFHITNPCLASEMCDVH